MLIKVSMLISNADVPRLLTGSCHKAIHTKSIHRSCCPLKTCSYNSIHSYKMYRAYGAVKKEKDAQGLLVAERFVLVDNTSHFHRGAEHRHDMAWLHTHRKLKEEFHRKGDRSMCGKPNQFGPVPGVVFPRSVDELGQTCQTSLPSWHVDAQCVINGKHHRSVVTVSHSRGFSCGG